MSEVRKDAATIHEAIYELTRAKLGSLASTSTMSSTNFITARKWAALRYRIDVMTEPIAKFALGLQDRRLYSAKQAGQLLAAVIQSPVGLTRADLLEVGDAPQSSKYSAGAIVADARRAGVVSATHDMTPRVIAAPLLLLTVLDDFPHRTGYIGQALQEDPTFTLEGLWDRFTEPEFSSGDVTDFKFALDRTPLS